MTSFASALLGDMGLQVPEHAVAVISDKQKTDLLAQQLKTGLFEIDYRKRDGSLTQMQITLNSDIIAKRYGLQTTQAKPQVAQNANSLSVYCAIRNEFRTIFRDKIERINEIKNDVSAQAQPLSRHVNLRLTNARLNLLFAWLQGVVIAELVRRGKPQDVDLQFTEIGAKLQVVERNTGLTVDL